MTKTAVFLLNLGGPDSLEAVQPFLFNLFKDPAIINIPNPVRYLLAKFISKKRTSEAKEIYRSMGGASPILKNTLKQVEALQSLLPESFKVFPVMRYWHPRAEEIIEQAIAWGAEKILCVPLYPQYSTTTTESSYKEILLALEKKKFLGSVSLACCYARHPLWIEGVANCIKPILKQREGEPYRLLFSAHGLPEKTIAQGDPYQKQIEDSVHDVVALLNLPSLDWSLAYQSRVGPLKWIGPATDQEIKRAGKEKKGVILVPISFVSEHSETLVELDIQYKELAYNSGVPFYERIPTVGNSPLFIKALKEIVEKLNSCAGKLIRPNVGDCEGKFKKCGGRFD